MQVHNTHLKQKCIVSMNKSVYWGEIIPSESKQLKPTGALLCSERRSEPFKLLRGSHVTHVMRH